MTIDYEIWNSMSMPEKKAYAEKMSSDSSTTSANSAFNDAWRSAGLCALPIAIGVLALTAAFISVSP